MRYGLDNNRHWIKNREIFPVQSSVLDEEVLLSEVVRDYHIPEPVSCRFLSRGDSDIYRVKTVTDYFYLKIYRPPHSLELAEAEASFVWALFGAGVPVVKPVRRTDGQFGCQVSAPEGIRPMLLYEEAPPPLPDELDEKLLTAIGEKVALAHNAADELDISIDLPEFDIDTFVKEKIYYTSQFLSEQERAYFLYISTNLKKTLGKLIRNSFEFGLCHADLVMSNVRLTDDGVITFVDFGNALKIWRAFELAVVYWSLENRYKDRGEKFWDAFLQGYKANRDLPEGLSERMPVMLVLRQIGFLGGNCATLPLRLGTEPFESGFIEKEMKRLRKLVEMSGVLT